MPIIGRCKNGEEFPADVAISKFDIRGTKVFTAVLRDISVQKRAENEQRLLAEAGVVLVSASIDDPHAALTGIAPIAVKTFADYCVVDLVEESEQARSFRRLKVAASGSAKVDLAERLCRVPLNWDRPLLSAKAIQTRRSELVPEISSGFLESRAQGEEHLRLLREIAPRSLIVVPLIAREELCGSISFLSCQPGRRYGPDDVRVAEELAWRAALSYDNARLYQAAQRAIRNRDQALGVVAHDLRNPLGAIILRASTLLCHPKGEVNRRRNGALDAILRAAERMNRMIEDLLDIHRIEAGKLATEFCPHSAKALVVDAVESARPLTRTLDLTLDLQDDLPYVWADRERVQQVFSNLIGNAIKFTGQEGRISIGAKRSGDAVCFWVADTGSGIAEAELPHIFDRFWQAKRADKRGAGLGLPICKGIIEAHDGRIWAESKRGMGSTFFFTIPVAREKGVQLSEPAPPPPEPHG